MSLHPRVQMFLYERDRARARGDLGVDRSITADLLRLGVPPTATVANTVEYASLTPEASTATATVEQTTVEQTTDAPKRRGRPPKPRCEHGNFAERCEECSQAEIEDSRAD